MPKYELKNPEKRAKYNEHPLFHDKPANSELLDDMVSKYGEANTAIYCLMCAYANIKSADDYNEAMESAKYFYDYAMSIQAPITSMDYMQLRNDVRFAVSKYLRKKT